MAQAKLVRVIQGKVLDVAVYIRPESLTYGKYVYVLLRADNKKQLFIPTGFAHGFVVLSQTALFQNKCHNYYHPATESGIISNDPKLNIDWILPINEIIVSKKGSSLKSFF